MNIPYPNLPPLRVELRLDSIDSRGQEVIAIQADSARPLALSMDREHTWYTFVINDETVDKISPGEQVTCSVSFVNAPDAEKAFHPNTSILFGDGVATRGVMRILPPS